MTNPRAAVGAKPGRGGRGGGLVRALAASCHPGPTVAVTALATALAAATGRGLPGTLLVAATVLVGQLSIGWLNDALDVPDDVAAGRGDKPVALGAVPAETVLRAAVVAAALCFPLSFASGRVAGAAHVGVVLGGWAYDLGLKRTPWSWTPYAVAFGLLPAYVVMGLPGTPVPPLWLPVAGALLGCAAHMYNVLPDIDDDRAAGLRNLPVLLGPWRTRLLGAVLLSAAGAVLAFGPDGFPPRAASVAAAAVTAALAAAAAVTGRRPRSKVPFVLVVLAAGLDLALLVARGASVV
jgi:4-hydroxybenzoate polyprenyltransferase